MILIKLLCQFIEVALRHGCSPAVIYYYDILKRYSHTQVGLDILDVSVFSLSYVAYAKIKKKSSKTCISREKTNLAHS